MVPEVGEADVAVEDDDPGWPAVHRVVFGALLPGFAIQRARANRSTDGLLLLRTLFLSFVTAVALIGVVVVILTSGEGMGAGMGGVPAALITAVAGVLAHVVGRVVERPLVCGDGVDLAKSYRTRLFLRIAFAETAALVGFVFVIQSGNPAVYLVGAAICAFGFVRLAPTRANLERDQEVLRDAGCGVSLTTALRAPMAS